ncbi:MAG: hypothetical protein R2880_03230 [Deinococcales bacterium]
MNDPMLWLLYGLVLLLVSIAVVYELLWGYSPAFSQRTLKNILPFILLGVIALVLYPLLQRLSIL